MDKVKLNQERQGAGKFDVEECELSDLWEWIKSVRAVIEGHLAPEEREAFREEFSPEGELKIFKNGSSNVLIVAPHGFPGDDDHTDYLAFFLAKELRGSYLINNKAFYKPGRTHPIGIPANLNRPWSKNPHTRRFMEILEEMAQELARSSSLPPLVICIHGMSDVNSKRFLAGDFCLGAGYTEEEREEALRPGGFATADREVVEGILEGLRERGFHATDGIPQYCGRKGIPGYLRRMEASLGRTNAVQIEVRYLGFRDPGSIVRTARELAHVIMGLSGYRMEDRNLLVGS